MGAVSLRDLYPDADLQIVNPPPTSQIIFRRNGTRDLASPGQLVVQDMRTGRTMTIGINGAGIARLQ
ncbi:MAG: hypothetical protein AAF449_12255 [Myxococcota bacterium]